jgi:hypothetical protein
MANNETYGNGTTQEGYVDPYGGDVAPASFAPAAWLTTIPAEAQQYAQQYHSGALGQQISAAQAANPAWANLGALQGQIQAMPGAYNQMLTQQLMGQAGQAQAAQAQMRASMAQQGLGGLAGVADLAGLGLQQQLAQQQAQITNQQELQAAQGQAIGQQQALEKAQVEQEAYVGDQLKEMLADVVSQLFTMYPDGERLSDKFGADLNSFASVLMGAVQLYYASGGQQGMDITTAERLMYTYPQFWKGETNDYIFYQEEKGWFSKGWDYLFGG